MQVVTTQLNAYLRCIETILAAWKAGKCSDDDTIKQVRAYLGALDSEQAEVSVQ